MSEESRQESLRQLIENVDYELLLSITRSDTQVKKDTTISQESSTPNFLEKVLERGNYEVRIALHQVNRTGGPRLSMAHQGFEHIAVIRNNSRGSWLELTICPVHGISRIDGKDMTGGFRPLSMRIMGSCAKLIFVRIR